ncbi:kanadaptin [Benincasa hispida]|uniref:kanadaptin n=1 Tax=Benincasa hispida TaxID=102211 RepID=UPI0019014865|nr:kanadaptin [Benincasa hispida]
MTTAMGPPPPRNTSSSSPMDSDAGTLEGDSTFSSTATKAVMGPPPPKNPTPPDSEPPTLTATQENEQPVNSTNSGASEPIEKVSDGSASDKAVELASKEPQSVAVPYTIPSWSGAPSHRFYLEVLKDGCIIDQFDVYEKGAYMFGRVDLCDFVLEHPTISRFHAVLQFRSNGNAYLYDLGSTHGSFINKNQVKKRIFVDLHVGDVIRFGHSSRLYIFQGPNHLMLPEADLTMIKKAKIREDTLDREASLRRARQEASLADGISWGMGEDAVEEAEDEVDEVTWQTYKGQLTEKQQKTREKVLKRTEKISHMKKEIDAIRAKDISQGGLTQGQQTQIARNEQRITQIMEELENLEETLNDSIRESLGARSGIRSRGKKGGGMEDDEEFLSDDDDFYDRTKKPSNKKTGENQSIETADSLLDKRDAIKKDMEEKRGLLLSEENKMESHADLDTGTDALDAYMSGLSSQLVLDKTTKLQNELSSLQSELDRILYLLKIADPSGEAAKKRGTSAQKSDSNLGAKPEKSNVSASVNGKPCKEALKDTDSKEQVVDAKQKVKPAHDSVEPNESVTEKIVDDTKDKKTISYTVVKPQWLGAIEEIKPEEIQKDAAPVDIQESDDFVDYKDRKEVLQNSDNKPAKIDSVIESAAPGLILRKRKQEDQSDSRLDASQQSTSSSEAERAEFKAEDAVALLLKHQRGYHGSDEEEVRHESKRSTARNISKKDEKKSKRVLGPEKPSFLDAKADYESWVPPEGQSGDGRTALNERYGY